MHRLLIACLRNEAPYILEWLAWHRSIGFDRFLIYTNDCDDRSEEILARLQTLGLVAWERNDAAFGDRVQMRALELAMAHPLYAGADWAAHFDLDEFLLVRIGAGQLDDLFAALPPGANMISIPWRSFGSGRQVAYAQGPVTDRFRHCAPRYLRRPWQMAAFKTMHRPLGHWGGIGPHRPFALRTTPNAIRWVNGDGRPMPPEYLTQGWTCGPRSFGDSLVQLNHYAVKSAGEFLAKAARGHPKRGGPRPLYEYFILRDINFEEDTALLAHAERRDAALAELMADPVLARLQRAAEEDLAERIAALRAAPPFDALFARVAAYRPRGSFTREEIGGRTVYSFAMPEVPDQDPVK